MKIHPVVDRLACVALVACLMIPAGEMIFPYVSGVLDGLEFNALEAVLSATVGFEIYGAFFG
jgi:hypothetical protein